MVVVREEWREEVDWTICRGVSEEVCGDQGAWAGGDRLSWFGLPCGLTGGSAGLLAHGDGCDSVRGLVGGGRA